ncbi:MAG: hypothetical protein ACLP0L_31115 [Solirubrobacteraceae bacterium]
MGVHRAGRPRIPGDDHNDHHHRRDWRDWHDRHDRDYVDHIGHVERHRRYHVGDPALGPEPRAARAPLPPQRMSE